jgi:nucleoside 2-deoxyribosyltransferase
MAGGSVAAAEVYALTALQKPLGQYLSVVLNDSARMKKANGNANFSTFTIFVTAEGFVLRSRRLFLKFSK